LLHLLAHLRNTATAPDPGDIRERTWRELRAFERRARELGVNPVQVRLAHYALCAALDDVVLNMPWGTQGRWHDEPLAKSLHQDDNAGAGFFEQLRMLRESLPESLPVIELMFVCLSLGMMGPYRALADGRAQVERARHHVFELIEKTAPPAPATLAPDATGVDAHFEPARGGVPLWVGASAAVTLIAGLYVWWLTGLNSASDAVYQAALAAPPSAMPALVRPPATPPPPPPPAPAIPGPAERLRAALADLPDIEVIGGASVIVRVPAHLLFPQPNATIGPGPLPERLAQALKTESGSIRVLGYTDSQPERSVAFPSNFALSTARAKAVRTVLARTVPEPNRIVAEGRADADPVAPNSSADGREKNRRIDIVLAAQP
jgi:type VI secretion system protein ImpK